MIFAIDPDNYDDSGLSAVDWEKLASIYQSLDWRWALKGHPTAADLRERAESLIQRLMTSNGYMTEAGGLRVTRLIEDEEDWQAPVQHFEVEFTATICWEDRSR